MNTVNISEKITAEVINRSVFSVSDRLKEDTVFYKSGLLILSGKGGELEKDIKHIDRIAGIADHFVVKGEMKKALLYAALLFYVLCVTIRTGGTPPPRRRTRWRPWSTA